MHLGNGQVFIVDDDPVVGRYMRALLETAGFKVRCYSSAKHFLDDDEVRHGCLIAKFCMSDMTGCRKRSSGGVWSLPLLSSLAKAMFRWRYAP
jgi:FixJ family two-component response regulator